ncbi:MAG: hypothetical protein MOB07_19840 [Acidobacteria bacterium]|nr:hypothetical protein [Acidobacteriota bacterium]
MSKLGSLETFSEAAPAKSTKGLSVYDVVPAVLEAKGTAMELMEMKKQLPVEAVKLVKHILDELTIAVRACGAGDVADILTQNNPEI